MRVLALVPAFNEEDCVEDTISSLHSACPAVDYVIINDGSSDGTRAVCETAGLNIVSLPVNTGLASAFRTGMKYAKRHGYDAVVQFDADGQHIPDYIAPMVKAMEDQDADIVIASRFLDGTVRPGGARGAGSRLITWLIRRTTHTTITDPTSGMRLYGHKMVEYFSSPSAFDVAPEPDTVALAARKGYKVIEVQAEMRERQGGESYLNLGNVVRYMSRTCLSIILFQFLR